MNNGCHEVMYQWPYTVLRDYDSIALFQLNALNRVRYQAYTHTLVLIKHPASLIKSSSSEFTTEPGTLFITLVFHPFHV